MKERLVGAAILVALVVVVVPALLSGPRPPAAAGKASRGAAEVRVVEIELAGRSATVAGEVADPATAPPPPTSAGVATSGTGESPPAQPAPAGVAEGTSPPAQTVDAGWAVQVAALSSREAADRMAGDLRQRGYPAFLLEYRADGRVFYRVRVGPEASRERADALAGRLQGEGMTTSVVAHP